MVTFADRRVSIHAGHNAAFGELRLVGAQAHGAAQVAFAFDDRELLGHGRDDRDRGLGVELGGRSRLDAGDVARVLDDHALHAEAQAQRRDAVLAGEAQRTELALDAADAEASGHADRVEAFESLCGAGFGGAVIGLDPLDLDLRVVGEVRRGCSASVTDR